MKKIGVAVLAGVVLMAGVALAEEFKAGDKVQVSRQGTWQAAIVKNYNEVKKCWNIHYDGYSDSWDECVGKKRIKK